MMSSPRLHHRTFTEVIWRRSVNAGEVFSKIPLEQIAEIALNLLCSLLYKLAETSTAWVLHLELKKGYLLGQGTGSIRCIVQT